MVWLRRQSCLAGRLGRLDRVNQFRFYELALGLRQIPAVGETPYRFEAEMRLRSAQRALRPYCGEDPPIPLTVSLGAAKKLLAALEELEAKIPELTKSSGGLATLLTDEKLEAWRFTGVRLALEKFEAVLSAECETRPAFIAPRRGIYDTEDLVNAAENAVPASLRPALSDKAIVELSSAGRCFAFGLFTAAGFHMCRAVEAALEDYYRRFTGKTGTLRGWHAYAEALEKAIAEGFTPAADPQTIAYLNQLRHSSRNPLMHPRIVLDEADASELFDLGRGVIHRMAKELLAANKPSRRRKPRMKAVP
jgi:hypothetical protein